MSLAVKKLDDAQIADCHDWNVDWQYRNAAAAVGISIFGKTIH